MSAREQGEHACTSAGASRKSKKRTRSSPPCVPHPSVDSAAAARIAKQVAARNVCSKWEELYELSVMTLDSIQSASSAYVQQLQLFAEAKAASFSLAKGSMEFILIARKCSEALCNFTLAGGASPALASVLLNTIASCLLSTFTQHSYSPKCDDYQHISEYLAICGYTGQDDIFKLHIHHYVELILLNKKTLSASELTAFETYTLECKREGSAGFWLHMSTGKPLERLWSYSSKKKKLREGSTQLSPGTRRFKGGACDWRADLAGLDTSRPLVIDLGCGYGVSLLGLAYVDSSRTRNYIGCDLSTVAVAYAKSISERWNLTGTCRFCVAPVEELVAWLTESYKGRVEFVLVQFPTPYKLVAPVPCNAATAKIGNAQLPSADECFMVTQTLVDGVLRLLHPGGSLYVQSNVEDVAVSVKHKVEQSDVSPSWSYGSEEKAQRVEGASKEKVGTQRQLLWASMGGELAVGEGWLSASPLSASARTETEAAYDISGKPVHRIMWTFPQC